jgi:hypothetical protein
MASEDANTKPTRRRTFTEFVRSSADAAGPALLLLEQVGEAGNIPILQGIAGVAGVILEICNVCAVLTHQLYMWLADFDFQPIKVCNGQ